MYVRYRWPRGPPSPAQGPWPRQARSHFVPCAWGIAGARRSFFVPRRHHGTATTRWAMCVNASPQHRARSHRHQHLIQQLNSQAVLIGHFQVQIADTHIIKHKGTKAHGMFKEGGEEDSHQRRSGWWWCEEGGRQRRDLSLSLWPSDLDPASLIHSFQVYCTSILVSTWYAPCDQMSCDETIISPLQVTRGFHELGNGVSLVSWGWNSHLLSPHN